MCRFETSSGAVLTVTEDSVLDEGGGEAEGYEPYGDLGFPNNRCGVSILSVALADLGENEMFFLFFPGRWWDTEVRGMSDKNVFESGESTTRVYKVEGQ